MSLHVLANHMATKGRGGDSMLVHMTPSEVHALQQLAEKHGTTLTINPETGLPEAFSLKSLLKAVAPVALGAWLGPAGAAFGGGLFSTAAGAGLAVGAGTAALTGDIGKGLSAGLGAYGGFGLGEGIAGLGESALSAGNQSAAESARLLSQAGAAPEAAQQFMAANAAAPYTASEALSAGIDKAIASPSALYDKIGFKGAAAAAAPLLLSTAPKTEMPGAGESKGYIRQYYYDPVSHSAKPLEPIAVKDWGSRTFEERVPYLPSAASGGIVALARGGAVQGYADGGMSQSDVDQLVREAAAQAGGTLSYADAMHAAGNLGISAEQLQNSIASGAITGAPSGVGGGGDSGPAPGSAAYNQMVGDWFSQYPDVTAADVQNAMSTYGLKQQDVQNAMRASGMSAADVHAAFAPDVGVPSTPMGGLAGISSNINDWVAKANAMGGTPMEKRALAYNAMNQVGMNMQDVVRATGKTIDELFPALPTTPQTNAPAGTTNPYGSYNTPGDLTRNADNTVTVQPNIPGRPYGGFTGIEQLKNAYTAGGGSLGQVLKPTTTYQNTGMSAKVYDYLMGRGAYPTQETGIGKNTRYYWGVAPTTSNKNTPYWINPKTGLYEPNPNYVDPALTTAKTAQPTEVINAGSDGGDSGSGAAAAAAAASGDGDGDGDGDGAGVGDGSTIARGGYIDRSKVKRMALGGLGALAGGGQAQFNLGGYSDGGRLLRGPGDGVSDSIPATIGDKQPARLADGEFVVPARIVSELGNGSTEAGARKLYAMMDRVQKARGKTTGKGKVAADTSAAKYLPA